jgi:hypothetical protein
VLVGSVCKNLIDLGSYLWKELDTRKYLKIIRDHMDVNAKRPNLHLLPLAFDRRRTLLSSMGSPAPWAVSGSAEAWNREGRWRGFRGDAHQRRRGAGAAGIRPAAELVAGSGFQVRQRYSGPEVVEVGGLRSARPCETPGVARSSGNQWRRKNRRRSGRLGFAAPVARLLQVRGRVAAAS